MAYYIGYTCPGKTFATELLMQFCQYSAMLFPSHCRFCTLCMIPGTHSASHILSPAKASFLISQAGDALQKVSSGAAVWCQPHQWQLDPDCCSLSFLSTLGQELNYKWHIGADWQARKSKVRVWMKWERTRLPLAVMRYFEVGLSFSIQGSIIANVSCLSITGSNGPVICCSCWS